MQSSLSRRVVLLDSIVNFCVYHAGKWNPTLKHNQSRDVLRLLINKLYGASKGFLFHASIRASHRELGKALGLSRVWVCRLVKMLRAAGWIRTYAPRLSNGRQAVTTFSAGGKLKRALITLLRSPQGAQHHRVNPTCQEFPSKSDERATDRQTDKPIPSGWVEGVANKWDMNTKIGW